MKTSIKMNFIYQMIYEILIIILPFATSPYISRVIGAEGLGVYSYSYSVAYYFVLFAMLGLKNYGNRSIARVRDDRKMLDKTFSDIFVLHAVISLFCIVVYVFYCIFIKTDRVYAVIQGAVVLSALFDISWFYFGIEEFRITVIRNIVIKLLTVLTIFMFVKSSSDLWIYCTIMSAGFLISQLALWIPLKKYVSFVKPDITGMKEHIKPLIILFIPAIAVSLYKYMDKIMIGALSSKEQLGFYDNAEKVNTIPLTVIGSFGTVMMPKMSNLAAKEDKKESNRYMSLSMQFVMCLAFALSFGLAGVGKVFAPFFWGKGFELSGTIIMYLSVTVPFISFANVIRTQYLIPNKKDNEYMLSVVMGAAVNLIINFILIPRKGALGAAVGTIAAEVVVCLVQTFSVRKDLPLVKFFKSFIIFIPLGIVMFIPVFIEGNLMASTFITLCIQIMTGAIIYAAASFIYFKITGNEIILSALNKFTSKIRGKK